MEKNVFSNTGENETNAVFCTGCGTKLPSEATRFCPKCGKAIENITNKLSDNLENSSWGSPEAPITESMSPIWQSINEVQPDNSYTGELPMTERVANNERVNIIFRLKIRLIAIASIVSLLVIVLILWNPMKNQETKQSGGEMISKRSVRTAATRENRGTTMAATATSPETTQPASTTRANLYDGGETEIHFMIRGEAGTYDAITDDFTSEIPDVTVICTYVSPSNYQEILAVRFAAGDSPDVMELPASASHFAEAGVLEDFEQWIENGVFETDHIPENVLDTGRINGTLWMIPQEINFNAMLINHTLIEELDLYNALDVDYLRGEQFTWNSFSNAHQIFYGAAQEAGFDGYFSAISSENFEAFRHWSRTTDEGSDLWSEDSNFGASEETIVNWFEYHQNLRTAGLLPDAETIAENRYSPVEETLFAQGKTAVANVYSSQYRQYAEQMPDAELIILTNPQANNGYQINTIYSSFIGVSTGSRNIEPAMFFVNHLINRQSATNILQLERGVPINTISQKELEPILDDHGKVILEFASETMQNRNAQAYILPPAGDPEIQVAFSDANSVALASQNPQAAATHFLSEVDAIIARW